ncbi:dephospho-CoA kinase [Ligilactobacillus equi]|uniref:Dephospho-CoA kinase n=1 Tax=Ligilactobacillus equi DSM 15833 = JCM 10991 TaxID=1423740 RepID=A0A0R1TN25_9LACO|nr:dephospho-CoA kinase [Ligilactobacillus equi]KRL78763.1 dephospho-CoA kinase [Ligilactobacillus equi DSM 15833 = JCM 10991]
MTFVLGLTGGIASGKSTISNFLEKYGQVIDADLIARQVVAPKSQGLAEISATFGPDYLTESGALDRVKMGQTIFNDEKQRQKLMTITSPLIRAEILRQLAQAKEQKVPLVVLDIPLLFDDGYEKYCDQVMVVYLPYALQLKRLMARNGFSQSQAQARISSQVDSQKLLAQADIVIDSSGTVEQTRQKVIEWLENNNFSAC